MLLKSVTKTDKKVQTNKKFDEKVIEGILRNDRKTLELIYRKDFESIRSMVNNFKNIDLEPGDIFQEGLTRAVMNIRKGVFKGESKFSTYLYGICRNICLKEYNRNKPIKTVDSLNIEENQDIDHYEILNLVLELKDKLEKNCKDIIDIKFNLCDDQDGKEESTSLKNIAAHLGIEYDNARQRFIRCMAKLRSLIQNNPRYHELLY
jgi:RNA polymerase sigma-70 factor (ECF subfamily)